ncbi:PD-(D/E)XK motif protein [Bradyrhizobium sp. CCGUVB1N3]|uniref:PD-(D/E)XK motif protein n=1 Tax=Bradyrhizobium sp. CCGUVB1N3 TaxID=2949629 RepID=UPI0020B32807|nr:PD-(D/E)XK motif protein [Bradyrhizobium sp. CCGUVB1N3]MCP3475056.1 PD-(D/E)XK motif protein [Bradyrhizobium sp. CCGUVB1N3]
MTERLRTLLSEIAPSSREGVFNVRRLEDGSVFYAGRDHRGCAAVLIETSEGGRTVPLRLAGIEATFSTPYQIVEPDTSPKTQIMTSIICINLEAEVVAYFANVMESLLPLMGNRPPSGKIAETVRQLVELFQRLRVPARKSVVGLIGELSIIDAAADTTVAVRSWRADPDDRFDFGAGKVRLDVKASSNRQRLHEVSFDQANPPSATAAIIASIWIEALGGGVALSELLATIEGKLAGRQQEVLKFRTVVADTLGDSLPQAMDWRFDKQLADSSLRYFDAAIIPAIRPPLPKGVSSARFVSDLSRCSPAELSSLRRSLDQVEQGLLPAE